MTRDSQSPQNHLLIAAVGASNGGEESLLRLLDNVGDASGMSIVFAQHHCEINFLELIEKIRESTQLEVVTLDFPSTKLKEKSLYVVPKNVVVEIIRGCAVIEQSIEQTEVASRSPTNATPIDTLLLSLAHDQLDRSVGIILSGAGTDGVMGLRAISEQGGLSLVQTPETAKFDAMPRMAATSGVADHVLPPEEIGKELVRYQQHLQDIAGRSSRDELRDEIISLIPLISRRLVDVTAHNFQHYKKATLSRRILRRMQVLQFREPNEYINLLDNSEQEVHTLFRELLIGVTCFFRDPEAYDSLAKLVIPSLFEYRQANEPVRIWVAGCATGEEAYSLAILCREYIDSLVNPPEVRIFATDIDQRALQVARQGVYSIGIEAHLSSERLKRFFVRRGKQYQASKKLRNMILFSPHNLISDPPFSRQDLISCRNLMIYLGSHLQNKLIPLFHYALRPSGYLFLGPSESNTSHGELFRQLDPKHRISQRKETTVGTSASLNFQTGRMLAAKTSKENPDSHVDLTNMMQKIILDEFAPKAVVVDEHSQVLAASADMEKYLSITSGRFQNNIIKMARSGLRIGLRATLLQAKTTRRKVQHENLSVKVGDKNQQVMITVQPMPELGEETGLFLVVFHDVGLPTTLQDGPTGGLADYGDSHSVIVQMERELEGTRKDLEKTMQEMEAANEELKSSNEELISMNEELQSANEELEASKEQIRSGSNALTRANNDLENLLRSTQIATIFLDEHLLIRSFTPAVKELYDLIPTDIGRPLNRFMPLVPNMPPLPAMDQLNDQAPIEHLVVLKSGKSLMRRVLPYIAQTGHHEGMVITFSDVSAIRESESRLAMALKAGGMAAWEWTAEATFWTDELYQLIGIPKDVVPSPDRFFQIIHEDDRQTVQNAWQALIEGKDVFEVEFRTVLPGNEVRWIVGVGEAVRDSAGKLTHIFGLNWDSTKEHLAAEALKESERRAKQASLSKSEFLANMSHEIRTPMTAILGYADLLSEGETDPTRLQYFQTIRRNGDFLLQIINDILDLSKIEANKIDVERQPFAPHHLVEDVRSIMEVRARESNLDLDVKYRGKLPALVESDPKRVKQILINLVGNAVKFTERGRVEVIVEFCDGSSPRLRFEVIDTGIGMTPQQKSALFQPFSQGDSSVNRRFGGTGLGLAISKRLANILGGNIAVESEVGKGSKFTVTIATGDVSGVEFIEPRVTTEFPDLNAEIEELKLDCRILVVDDRREIRFLSQRLLTIAGATVIEAEDGEQALQLVQQAMMENDSFDLILLDMQMPKLDGYATAERLRSLGFHNPIVALTADAMQGDMGRCIDCGCNAYLSKPVDTQRLLQIVASFTQCR